MLAPLPHRYSASLSRTFASGARMEGASLDGGAPPKLDGLDGNDPARSPEQMLLSSLGLCMLTTFEAFAARDGIELLRWDARISGEVDRTPECLMFTSIVLELELSIAGNVDHVEATLEDAKQYCLVLNSLRVPGVIETRLHTPDGPHEVEDDDVPPLARHVRPLPRSAAAQRHAC
jgi:organic hydroperoxide reductase OsmC/OhrA